MKTFISMILMLVLTVLVTSARLNLRSRRAMMQEMKGKEIKVHPKIAIFLQKKLSRKAERERLGKLLLKKKLWIP